MLPLECKMPDLSDIAGIRLQARSALHALIGDPGITPKEGGYRRNFTRLTDKAIREYQLARQAILNEINELTNPPERSSEEGRPIFIFAYIDHFETCVNAVNRVLNLFERLRSEPLLSKLPREMRRSLEACSRSLRDVRNLVEHIEDAIRKGEIADGQPVMLGIGGEGDRAVIGPHEVEFADVAQTIRKLHEIGLLLFNVEQSKPASSGPGAAFREELREQ